MELKKLLKEPVVMAIINTTPDSFYTSSRVSEKELIDKCDEHLSNGASILDVGGYSTKPGAEDVTLEEELNRTVTAVHRIRKQFPDVLISIDTFRRGVAEACLNAGANIVNDVSGGADEEMFPFIMKNKVPYVLMHMRGTPQTMSRLCNYRDVVSEVIFEIKKKLDTLISAGVEVIVDPGFGFAKELEQNYELLKKLKDFEVLGCPILAGVSRKSMIYKLLDISPEEALNGTSVLNTVALLNGASVLRVHDSLEAKQCIELFKRFRA